MVGQNYSRSCWELTQVDLVIENIIETFIYLPGFSIDNENDNQE